MLEEMYHMTPTPEDLIRMRDEALPDHISIDDNGDRVFCDCNRCGGYVLVWASDGDRADVIDGFMEGHWECPGLPVLDEDEIIHEPALSDEERINRRRQA